MANFRILIIDDDEVSSKYVRAKLEQREYNVDTAICVSEAFRCIETAFPDLILVDIGLPHGDGYRFCRKIREWADTPIIMTSGNKSEMDEVRCLDMGADDFILRPFSMEILTCRIKAALRRSAKKKYVSEYSLANSQ